MNHRNPSPPLRLKAAIVTLLPLFLRRALLRDRAAPCLPCTRQESEARSWPVCQTCCLLPNLLLARAPPRARAARSFSRYSHPPPRCEMVAPAFAISRGAHDELVTTPSGLTETAFGLTRIPSGYLRHARCASRSLHRTPMLGVPAHRPSCQALACEWWCDRAHRPSSSFRRRATTSGRTARRRDWNGRSRAYRESSAV